MTSRLGMFLLGLLFSSGATCEHLTDVVGKDVGGIPVSTVEAAALEPVCKLILSHNVHGKRFWYDELGKTGILNRPEYIIALGAPWLYHYCWGKVAKMRYHAATATDQKNFLLNQVRLNMDYCIREGTPHQWPYLPVMYAEKAEAFRFEKRYSEAIIEALKALNLNPAYTWARILSADIYIDLNLNDKALEMVVEGLRFDPESKGLKRRFRELGGGDEYPKPYQEPTPVGSDITGAVPSELPIATESAVAPRQGSGEIPTNAVRESGKKNPYCRFCADE